MASEEQSNEDLVSEIQAGRTDLMPVLWKQIEKLVHWKAHRIAFAIHPDDCFSAEDLEKDLFQTGYIAMNEAVETYKPESGCFSTWFMYHLKTEFAVTTGWRTKTQKLDPIHSHMSLDAPVSEGDEDSASFGDLIEDPRGKHELETAEEAVFCDELRKTLDMVLSDIPENCSDVLRRRYYMDKTIQAVADETGADTAKVLRDERSGLRKLREPKRAKYLRPFLNFDCYHGTGLQSFNNSGMSIQERYVMKCDRK